MNGGMKPAWQDIGFQSPELRTAMLCLTALGHGLFSSPAPPDLGLAEGLVALCLLTAAVSQLPHLINAHEVITSSLELSWL